jgi:hypothetical protein
MEALHKSLVFFSFDLDLVRLEVLEAEEISVPDDVISVVFDSAAHQLEASSQHDLLALYLLCHMQTLLQLYGGL